MDVQTTRTGAAASEFLRAVRGEPGAFAGFLARHEERIARIVRALVPAGDAEDVFQEVCLRLVAKGHLYDASRPLLPWLDAVTRQVCAAALRGGRGEALPGRRADDRDGTRGATAATRGSSRGSGKSRRMGRSSPTPRSPDATAPRSSRTSGAGRSRPSRSPSRVRSRSPSSWPRRHGSKATSGTRGAHPSRPPASSSRRLSRDGRPSAARAGSTLV